jgi:hypothetical protein
MLLFYAARRLALNPDRYFGIASKLCIAFFFKATNTGLSENV